MLVTLHQFDIDDYEYFSDRNLNALNKLGYAELKELYDNKSSIGEYIHEAKAFNFYSNSCVFGITFSFDQKRSFACQQCGKCRECNKYKQYDFIYCDQQCVYSIYHQDKAQQFIGDPNKKYFGGLINRSWLNKIVKFVDKKEVNFILRVAIPGIYDHYVIPKPKSQQHPSFRLELIPEMSIWKISQLEEALRKQSNYDRIPENIITRAGPILSKEKKDVTLILIETSRPVWYSSMQKEIIFFPGLWDNVLVVESNGDEIQNVCLRYG